MTALFLRQCRRIRRPGGCGPWARAALPKERKEKPMEQTERMAIRCSGITKTFGEVVANDQIELKTETHV